MGRWPFLGDSPVARARKMALAYREALGQRAPDLVAEMDERFVRWGERWHNAAVAVDLSDDDWVSTEEAAALIQISRGSMSRLRVEGRIKGRYRKGERGFEFRVGDVYKLSTELRGRGSNWRGRGSTDKVPANGSSVENDQ